MKILFPKLVSGVELDGPFFPQGERAINYSKNHGAAEACVKDIGEIHREGRKKIQQKLVSILYQGLQ